MQLSDEEKRTALGAFNTGDRWWKWMAALLFIAGLCGIGGSSWSLFFRADTACSHVNQTLFGATFMLATAAARLFVRETEAGNLRRLVRRFLEEEQKGKAPLGGTPSTEGTAEQGAPADRPRE
jgi:hypothetical protein